LLLLGLIMISKYWTQLFLSPPTLTEEDLPNQTGKVFIVTGGISGLGFELVRILYCKGVRVYIVSRSQSKAEEAIKTIRPLPLPAK
jgi:short chain dehydrogenase